MPIQHVKKVAREIRQRWTSEERLRRAHLADVMQARLMQLAGGKLAPAPVRVRL
ncbi:hypothetical protein [Adhaeretor mobilis]|uniref:Uncharacterized protein n=1 Tax=Adhaeretor mobilis TaxID=1930276 RepID=A0A517N1Y2_9BACT|nr:hypothetical protein [Adhaeretor mobilis]QDT01144.1 hypothetical protein HG15A2_44860 [Adhaeretor mobilis]